MAFSWNTNNITKTNICDINEVDNEHIDIVLGRIKFTNVIEGCCGQIRNDSIFPVESSSFESFKIEAFDIINKYEKEKDMYSIEYFYGKPGQNFREDGESIFRFELEDALWNFYEKNQIKLSVKDITELKLLWHL